MSVIMIGVGETRLGRIQQDKDGNVIKEMPAQWIADPEGGSVAVCQLDPETMEPESDVEIFGDWDAAGYLARVLDLLHPNRKTNIPNLKAMIQAAAADHCNICDYCQSAQCYWNCNDCIVQEWKDEEE